MLRRRTGAASGFKKPLLVAMVVMVAFATSCGIVDSREERAGEDVLDSVEVHGSFEFRGRHSFGTGGTDIHDVYLGPASNLSPQIVSVPTEFKPESISNTVLGDEYRRIRAWSVEMGVLECEVGFKEVVEPAAQRAYAGLSSEEMNEVEKGSLAVIELSSYCA